MAVVRRFSVPSGQKVHATAQGSILLPLRPLIRLARALHRAPVQERCCASACRCHMPRDKGSIGETGSKHKKKASKKNQPQVRATAEPLVITDDDDTEKGMENARRAPRLLARDMSYQRAMSWSLRP